MKFHFTTILKLELLLELLALVVIFLFISTIRSWKLFIIPFILLSPDIILIHLKRTEATLFAFDIVHQVVFLRLLKSMHSICHCISTPCSYLLFLICLIQLLHFCLYLFYRTSALSLFLLRRLRSYSPLILLFLVFFSAFFWMLIAALTDLFLWDILCELCHLIPHLLFNFFKFIPINELGKWVQLFLIK